MSDVVKYETRFPEIIAELNPRMAAAVQESAQLVVNSARSRVPVATGRLRDSIHAKEGKNPLRVQVVADAQAMGTSGAPYGHFVEFGTVYGPAQPFLVPAVEETRAAATEIGVAALRAL